jgi:hypothetical protein
MTASLSNVSFCGMCLLFAEPPQLGIEKSQIDDI